MSFNNDVRNIIDFEDDFISIKNANVYNLDNALRVSGFPMSVDTQDAKLYDYNKNLARGIKLGNVPPLSGHNQFTHGIIVAFDIKLSCQVWGQLQRYHFIEFTSSQSKMHKLVNMNIEESCNPFVDKETIEHLKSLVEQYKSNPTQDNFKRVIYNCPLGLRLEAGVTTNYCQLLNIYRQRKYHRLSDEWKPFTEWIEQLPLFKELCLKE